MGASFLQGMHFFAPKSTSFGSISDAVFVEAAADTELVSVFTVLASGKAAAVTVLAGLADLAGFVSAASNALHTNKIETHETKMIQKNFVEEDTIVFM